MLQSLVPEYSHGGVESFLSGRPAAAAASWFDSECFGNVVKHTCVCVCAVTTANGETPAALGSEPTFGLSFSASSLQTDAHVGRAAPRQGGPDGTQGAATSADGPDGGTA